MDWQKMSAADLGRSIARGKIDPVELTEAFLAAIASSDGAGRVYARVSSDRALAEARAAAQRQKIGQLRSPLDGVPISWKDLYDTAGIPTEHGSRLLRGRVPSRDARVLELAGQAGLVCLGKTHQTELAFSGLGLNPMTETPPNSLDPARVAGGSSSGAAVSVANGLAAAGIGSDTGGSVRVPSAWNGLVGLKTTSGRLSLEGVLPLCPRFDTVGPLCRTVEDAGLLLGALEGKRMRAPITRQASDLRMAVLETVAFDDLDDGVGEAVDEAISAISAAGARIERIEWDGIAEAMSLAPILFTTEAWALWGERITASGPEDMFAPVRERFRSGADHAGSDYIAAWQRLDALREKWHARAASFDAILLPTVPSLPPRIDELLADHDYFTRENLRALRNTRIGNLFGLPALTLPTKARWVGLSLNGKPFGEEHLLGVGAAVERVLT